MRTLPRSSLLPRASCLDKQQTTTMATRKIVTRLLRIEGRSATNRNIIRVRWLSSAHRPRRRSSGDGEPSYEQSSGPFANVEDGGKINSDGGDSDKPDRKGTKRSPHSKLLRVCSERSASPHFAAIEGASSKCNGTMLSCFM